MCIWGSGGAGHSPSLLHVRHHQLRQEEGRFDINRQDLERGEGVHGERMAGGAAALLRHTHLVPDLLRGVQGVSEERVDSRIGHQDVNPPTPIQRLLPEQAEMTRELAD